MRQIIALALSLFCSGLIYAQDQPNFTVTVSTDSVLLGNYVEVTFTLENAAMDDFQPPRFEGFQIISGPNQSSSFSMVNGAVTQSASYTYYLEPADIGNYYIAPASVQAGEKVLETTPIEILVAPNPDGILQNQQERRDIFGGDAFGNDFFGRNDFFGQDFFGRDRLKEQTPNEAAKKSKKKRKTYKL